MKFTPPCFTSCSSRSTLSARARRRASGVSGPRHVRESHTDACHIMSAPMPPPGAAVRVWWPRTAAGARAGAMRADAGEFLVDIAEDDEQAW